MASLDLSVLTFRKRVPLTISRGTSTHTTVLWLRWEEEGVEGWGEAVPFAIDDHPQTLDGLQAAFAAQRAWLATRSGWERAAVERELRGRGAPSALIAAVNLAHYDWLGKRVGQPTWRLLGLAGAPLPLTSVTIGINSPEGAVRRLEQWREGAEVRACKVKLGSPAGVAADRAMFAAVRAALPADCRVSVDANGGWTLPVAIAMAAWLADHGVDHLEQPLPRGREAELAALRATMKIPLLVDESCRTSDELVGLAGSVDGINIKLMKCGGLDGALRLIATARSHGLKVLLGCYGNSALANTGAAQLGALVDYLDLDSHLNLADDAFRGAPVAAGRFALSAQPGFGVTHV